MRHDFSENINILHLIFAEKKGGISNLLEKMATDVVESQFWCPPRGVSAAATVLM